MVCVTRGLWRLPLQAALIAAVHSAQAAVFNDVMPGARAMGMGMAYTAVSDDPYGMFFNPAGPAGSTDIQLAGTVGRMVSPVGPLALTAAAFMRPFPLLRANSYVGAAFLSERQLNAGDKDEFFIHYSEPFRYSDLAAKLPYVPALDFLRPIKTGANVKIVNVKTSKGRKIGLGGDVGAQLDSGKGLKFGLSVNDLTTAATILSPSFNLGVSYLLNRWLLLASDLRVRSGSTQLYPGVEASFYEGLLKARVGKGVPLDGVSQVAFGAGINFSPIFLDFAMTVPWNGVNRQGGASQITLNYRFGAPSFYGRFIGSAARQAEDLKNEILVLEERKKTLESQTSAASANADAASQQLRAMEARLKNLQDQVRKLELSLEEKNYEVQKAKPHPPASPSGNMRSAPAAPRPARAQPFPRKHVVAPGDTLRSLAAQYYGDPNLWELIYNANTDKIERGLPQEGAMLTIPAPNR